MSQENVEVVRRAFAAFEGDFWFVYEFRGARIAKMSVYAHEDEALEAAGLSE